MRTPETLFVAFQNTGSTEIFDELWMCIADEATKTARMALATLRVRERGGRVDQNAIDDVVQEVSRKLLGTACSPKSRFDPTKGTVLAYVKQAVHNACIDYCRRFRGARRGKGPRLVTEADLPMNPAADASSHLDGITPEVDVNKAELLRTLNACVEHLPENEKAVMKLGLQEVSTKQAALMLGMSWSALLKSRSKAKAHLVESLAARGFDAALIREILA